MQVKLKVEKCFVRVLHQTDSHKSATQIYQSILLGHKIMNMIYLTGIINTIYFRLVKQEENKKKIGNAHIILFHSTP